MRKLLYLIIQNGNIVASYTQKDKAKDDMESRNSDIINAILKEEGIDDPEIKDIEDACYDADGFEIGTVDITNINFDKDPGEEIMLETLEGGNVFSVDELKPFVK